MAGCRTKCPTVRARIGAGPRRRNCFGVRWPRRLPTPPAGITTPTSRTAALLVTQPREDDPSRGRLQDTRHGHVDALADPALALIDDDHRAIVEVGHALPTLLALAQDVHVHRFTGDHGRFERVRKLVDVQDGDATHF